MFFVRNYLETTELIEVVAKDGSKNITLPDGSKVTLGQKSELHYEEKFGEVRLVKFTGQGYFNITKDDKPFVISMNGGEVEVLGTAFDLVSSASEISVTLDHGKVSLTGLDESIEISTGESARLDKTTQRVTRLDSAPSNYMSWRTGEFAFNDTPLLEVVNDLQKYYNVEFKVSKRVSNCKVTANFKNLSVNQVCDALESILSVKVNQKGTNLVIRGKGCE